MPERSLTPRAAGNSSIPAPPSIERLLSHGWSARVRRSEGPPGCPSLRPRSLQSRFGESIAGGDRDAAVCCNCRGRCDKEGERRCPEEPRPHLLRGAAAAL